MFLFYGNIKSNFEGTSTVKLKEVSSSSLIKLALVYLCFIQT
jgi:hypothetical protein